MKHKNSAHATWQFVHDIRVGDVVFDMLSYAFQVLNEQSYKSIATEQFHKVSGMLLYAKTDEEIYPNNVYQMSGNQIMVSTLDLNKPFAEIAEQLNTIAKTHFDL